MRIRICVLRGRCNGERPRNCVNETVLDEIIALKEGLIHAKEEATAVPVL
jgi:hypothetical protein